LATLAEEVADEPPIGFREPIVVSGRPETWAAEADAEDAGTDDDEPPVEATSPDDDAAGTAVEDDAAADDDPAAVRRAAHGFDATLTQEIPLVPAEDEEHPTARD